MRLILKTWRRDASSNPRVGVRNETHTDRWIGVQVRPENLDRVRLRVRVLHDPALVLERQEGNGVPECPHPPATIGLVADLLALVVPEVILPIVGDLTGSRVLPLHELDGDELRPEASSDGSLPAGLLPVTGHELATSPEASTAL